MLGKLQSSRFRKHPGGAQAVVSTFKVLLLIAVVMSAVGLIISFFSLFNSKIAVYVTSKEILQNNISASVFTLTNPRTSGILTFEVRSVIEWLLLPRFNHTDIFMNAFSFIITWQLFRILKEIDMVNPFYTSIMKRINLIYQMIFIGGIFLVGRYFFFSYVIGDITDKAYKLSDLNYLSSTGYFSLGSWLIIYLFAHVYKKGVLLQQEQELTI
ncbi:MAG: DUF2975 domain-containing protein [Pedobacter sp.]|nr:MAG: DUF2975 domain-containing protein [Pedobacter sp.]